METFSALLALCAGNSPVTGEFPTQRPVTQRFDVFFDPRLNKRLSKQSWGWWFETSSCPLWRHLNEHGEILNYVSHSTVMWSIIIQNAPKAHKPLSHIHVRFMSVSSPSQIFHRIQQYCCYAQCIIEKKLGQWKIRYWLSIFIFVISDKVHLIKTHAVKWM